MNTPIDSLTQQNKNLREINKTLIKALEVAWDNRAFLPIKDRAIIRDALDKVKS